ncbi:sugar-phosphatase [Vallitalea okinawensis]|uniref:sugar-phosphatase n=1 Tax=Vallitalea okinawensis TaxID=2078660 RepID=UPI000CFC06A2|nr:sugar-phosphatase [Vallitalea okinawensis]
MYKLIAVDMDGTLLNKDKEISKANFDMIQEAKKQGKKVVIATGRPLLGVKRHLKHLDLISDEDYVIAFNGSLVQTTKSGHIISKTTLSVEDYKELYEVSQDLGVHIHALTNSKVTTPVDNKYTHVEADINGIPIDIMPVDEIDDATTIVKVMFIDEPELLDEIISKLPKAITDKYTILRSAPYFLEFLHKSVNKGAGVKAVAKELGFKSEEIICIGDAGNDIAMIEYAGLGVAMENAFEEVKEVASYVTRSNDHDGVAHVIKKFMLNEEVA